MPLESWQLPLERRQRPKLRLALAATETAKAEAAAARTAQQAAETAQAAAEVARIAAEENADGQVALAVTANMAAQVADAAVKQAEAALMVAQDMQKQAEDERGEAIAARDEAQRLLGLAEAARALAEQRQNAAEQQQVLLEDDAEEVRQELIQVQAQDVFNGLPLMEANQAGTGDPTVTASYNENAGVDTAPDVTFGSKTGRSARPWFVTSFSNRTSTVVDRLDVYTDVERLPDVPFKDSTYNSDSSVVNAQGEVFGVVLIGTLREDTASSSFPTRTGREARFDVVHRGMTSGDFMMARTAIEIDHDGIGGDFTAADRNTPEFRAALEAAGITRSQYNQYVRDTGFRDEDRHPYRYSAERSGTLGGASGTFRCAGRGDDAATATCIVDYRGGTSFNFSGTGTWEFFPRRATEGVDVLDEIYMYFGWWSRQNVEDGSWSFRAFHGSSEVGGQNSRDEDVTDVNGKATYIGPAVGYYAIYLPLGTQSGHGEFNATATLTADFDTAAESETLEGRIDQFEGHSDWFLTLKQETVVRGATSVTTDGVVWSINNIPHEGGEWEAAFYSNLENDKRENVIPSGIAGTFKAEYSTVGKLIGAFGAHCRTGC